MTTIDRDSVEIRSFTITAKDPATSEPVDITADAVSVAFTLAKSSDRPTTWIVCPRNSEDPTLVDVQFGPAGFQLTPGTYRRWVKFTDGPETPVLEAADVLTVT